MRTIYIFLLFSICMNTLIKAQHSCSLNMTNIIPSGNQGPDIDPPTLEDPDPVVERSVEGYRMLYWVHGLDGDTGSWQSASASVKNGIVSENFPPRKVYNQLPDYFSFQSSLLNAAVNLELGLEDDLQPNYNRRDGMIIAHSQGGLVSRRLDMYLSNPINANERDFGGIITFNTSHQGAQLLNNKLKFLDFIDALGTEMAAGPVKEIVTGNIGLILANAVFDLEGLATKISEHFVELYGPTLISNSTPKITDDYNVGAAPLEELNTYIPDETFLVPFFTVKDTITTVNDPSFTAIERNSSGNFVEVTTTIPGPVPVPISLATIHYFLTSVNDVLHFKGQDHEHILAARAHLTKLQYQSKVDIYNFAPNSSLSAMRNWYNFLNPLTLSFYALVHNFALGNRDSYQRGVHFLNNFDGMYRTIIGARVLGSSNESDYVCICTYTHNNGVQRIINLSQE
ncbi:MAG: hypothetical protein IPI60_20580 [Saprospiraceae bacterium]|nr:hypothetical protein [Saprospiraceae bacterium]